MWCSVAGLALEAARNALGGAFGALVGKLSRKGGKGCCS